MEKQENKEMENPSLGSPLLLANCGGSEITRASLGSGEEKAFAFFTEVKRQLWLAGPLIAASLLQHLLQVISVMFLGHLGELALSGASIDTSFAGGHWFQLLGRHLNLFLITNTLLNAVIRVHTSRVFLILSLSNYVCSTDRLLLPFKSSS